MGTEGLMLQHQGISNYIYSAEYAPMDLFPDM